MTVSPLTINQTDPINQGEDAPKPTLLTTVSKRSPFGALLSRTLPQYHGEHAVGVCDVELPVPRQSFGTFKHKALPNAEAGLTIDTVLFTLFYPCNIPEGKKSHVVWFPKLSQTIDGFLKMAKRTPNFLYRAVSYPIAAAAISGTTFPAYEDASLKDPPSEKKWQLMVFSHGVGCSRLMYSAFAGEMASRGYIVAAVEHRDGTGPSTTIVTEDGQKKNLDWLQWSDLEWPDLEEAPTDDTMLRHDQIKLRLTEFDEVIKAMRKISEGAPVTQISVRSPDFDWMRWKCVDADKPIMSGHSLGGTAAIAASADDRFSFASIVVFDPAMQRLDPWTAHIPYDMLVINSEEFTVSSDFQRLMKAAENSKSAYIYSIAGTTHPSFSDVFLILPRYINRKTGLKIEADEMIHMSVRSVSAFLAGHVEDSGNTINTMAGTRTLKKPIGKPGEMLWHRVH